MALVADAQDHAGRTRQLLDLARELGTVRDADGDAGTTPRLLEALDAIRGQLGETPAPADLLAALHERPGWDRVKSSRRLAGLLNPLGIVRHQVRAGGRRRWCSILQADQLPDLQARYGSSPDAAGEPDTTSDTIASSFSPPKPVTTGASGHNPHEERRVPRK